MAAKILWHGCYAKLINATGQLRRLYEMNCFWRHRAKTMLFVEY